MKCRAPWRASVTRSPLSVVSFITALNLAFERSINRRSGRSGIASIGSFPTTLLSSKNRSAKRIDASMPSRTREIVAGRVEDWRAGLGRSSCSLLARSFVCECHTISAVPRFQPPPRRTQHADFPHCALLFASPQGLWGRSCRSGFRRWSNHSVAIEQLQSLVQPFPTPPRPAEALSVPGTIPRTSRTSRPSP